MKSTKHRVMVSQNVRSLKANSLSLNCFLHEHKSSIIALQEIFTWDDCLLQVPNFNFIHKTRTGKMGGGVALGYRQDLQATEIEEIGMMSKDIETISITIKSKQRLYATAYRPPTGSPVEFCNHISKILQYAKKIGFKAIIATDSNINYANKESRAKQKLDEVLTNYNAKQLC